MSDRRASILKIASEIEYLAQNAQTEREVSDALLAVSKAFRLASQKSSNSSALEAPLPRGQQQNNNGTVSTNSPTNQSQFQGITSPIESEADFFRSFVREISHASFAVTPTGSEQILPAMEGSGNVDGNVSNWLRETFSAAQPSQRLAGNAKEVQKRQKQLGGKSQVTPRKTLAGGESTYATSMALSESSAHPTSSSPIGFAGSPIEERSMLRSEATSSSPTVLSPDTSAKVVGSPVGLLPSTGSGKQQAPQPQTASPTPGVGGGAGAHQQRPSRVSFPLNTDFTDAKVPSNYLPTPAHPKAAEAHPDFNDAAQQREEDPAANGSPGSSSPASPEQSMALSQNRLTTDDPFANIAPISTNGSTAPSTAASVRGSTVMVDAVGAGSGRTSVSGGRGSQYFRRKSLGTMPFAASSACSEQSVSPTTSSVVPRVSGIVAPVNSAVSASTTSLDGSNAAGSSRLSDAAVMQKLQQHHIRYLDIDNVNFNIFALAEELDQERIHKEGANPIPTIAPHIPGSAVATDVFVAVCLNVFLRYSMVEDLELDVTKLKSFLLEVAKYYSPENPYHNAIHAADVLQTAHMYLITNNVYENFFDREILCVLLSALAHDVGHLGVNNIFLSKIQHPVARLYNGFSPLENMHSLILSQILFPAVLSQPTLQLASTTASPAADHSDDDGSTGETEEMLHATEESLLHSLSQSPVYFFSLNESVWKISDTRELLAKVTDVIIGTDMKFHGAALSQAVDMFRDGFVVEDGDIDKIIKLIIHAADLSNPMKPREVYQQWAHRVVAEFFIQGDAEKRRHLPVSMGFDRDVTRIPEMQTGFIGFVVRPYAKALNEILPAHWLERLEENAQYMSSLAGQDYEGDQAVAQMSSVPWFDRWSRVTPLIFSADHDRPLSWLVGKDPSPSLPPQQEQQQRPSAPLSLSNMHTTHPTAAAAVVDVTSPESPISSETDANSPKRTTKLSKHTSAFSPEGPSLSSLVKSAVLRITLGFTTATHELSNASVARILETPPEAGKLVWIEVQQTFSLSLVRLMTSALQELYRLRQRCDETGELSTALPSLRGPIAQLEQLLTLEPSLMPPHAGEGPPSVEVASPSQGNEVTASLSVTQCHALDKDAAMSLKLWRQNWNLIKSERPYLFLASRGSSSSRRANNIAAGADDSHCFLDAVRHAVREIHLVAPFLVDDSNTNTSITQSAISHSGNSPSKAQPGNHYQHHQQPPPLGGAWHDGGGLPLRGVGLYSSGALGQRTGWLHTPPPTMAPYAHQFGTFPFYAQQQQQQQQQQYFAYPGPSASSSHSHQGVSPLKLNQQFVDVPLRPPFGLPTTSNNGPYRSSTEPIPMDGRYSVPVAGRYGGGGPPTVVPLPSIPIQQAVTAVRSASAASSTHPPQPSSTTTSSHGAPSSVTKAASPSRPLLPVVDLGEALGTEGGYASSEPSPRSMSDVEGSPDGGLNSQAITSRQEAQSRSQSWYYQPPGSSTTKGPPIGAIHNSHAASPSKFNSSTTGFSPAYASLAEAGGPPLQPGAAAAAEDPSLSPLEYHNMVQMELFLQQQQQYAALQASTSSHPPQGRVGAGSAQSRSSPPPPSVVGSSAINAIVMNGVVASAYGLPAAAVVAPESPLSYSPTRRTHHLPASLSWYPTNASHPHPNFHSALDNLHAVPVPTIATGHHHLNHQRNSLDSTTVAVPQATSPLLLVERFGSFNRGPLPLSTSGTHLATAASSLTSSHHTFPSSGGGILANHSVLRQPNSIEASPENHDLVQLVSGHRSPSPKRSHQRQHSGGGETSPVHSPAYRQQLVEMISSGMEVRTFGSSSTGGSLVPSRAPSFRLGAANGAPLSPAGIGTAGHASSSSGTTTDSSTHHHHSQPIGGAMSHSSTHSHHNNNSGFGSSVTRLSGAVTPMQQAEIEEGCPVPEVYRSP